jgi:hypothetical protein
LAPHCERVNAIPTPLAPNAAVQALPSWDEWGRQVSYSRTLGGVHYRLSNEAGEEMGRKVARMALANVMRPLPNVAAKKMRQP